MEAVQRSSHGRRVGSAQTCQRLRPLGTVAGHSYLDLPCRIQSCFGLWFCKLLLHGICSSFHHRSPNKLIRFWESQSEHCELALSLSLLLSLSLFSSYCQHTMVLAAKDLGPRCGDSRQASAGRGAAPPRLGFSSRSRFCRTLSRAQSSQTGLDCSLRSRRHRCRRQRTPRGG